MEKYYAWDVKAGKKVRILNPQIVRLRTGVYAVRGKSAETGITVYSIIGKRKTVSQVLKEKVLRYHPPRRML